MEILNKDEMLGLVVVLFHESGGGWSCDFFIWYSVRFGTQVCGVWMAAFLEVVDMLLISPLKKRYAARFVVFYFVDLGTKPFCWLCKNANNYLWCLPLLVTSKSVLSWLQLNELVLMAWSQYELIHTLVAKLSAHFS